MTDEHTDNDKLDELDANLEAEVEEIIAEAKADDSDIEIEETEGSLAEVMDGVKRPVLTGKPKPKYTQASTNNQSRTVIKN